MRVLSLFSGGGLGDYGLELAGMEIVAQVEIDEYARKVLSLRWPSVPKFTDVNHFRGSDVQRIDLVSGGFPCQDISTAGKGAGITGEKSGLWKEMLRIICEVRPKYVLVENVAALLGRGLGTVLRDLAGIGYDCEWECLPASAFGAPHRRNRVWIVGYTNSLGRQGEDLLQQGGFSPMRAGKTMANSISNGLPEGYQEGRGVIKPRIFTSLNRPKELDSNNSGQSSSSVWGRWKVEPNVGRVAHGVTKRVDRLKLLGNGQVVQVVQWIGERILEFDKQRLA